MLKVVQNNHLEIKLEKFLEIKLEKFHKNFGIRWHDMAIKNKWIKRDKDKIFNNQKDRMKKGKN